MEYKLLVDTLHLIETQSCFKCSQVAWLDSGTASCRPAVLNFPGLNAGIFQLTGEISILLLYRNSVSLDD